MLPDPLKNSIICIYKSLLGVMPFILCGIT
jgi:hypothetical protein